MNMFSLVLAASVLASALGQWQLIPGTATHLSARGDILWRTTEANNVLYVLSAGWVYTPGGGQYVAAGADNSAWLLRLDLFSDNIFRYNLATSTFEHMPGSLRQISAADSNNAVGINYLGDIWQWKNNAWMQLPDKATQVSMGVDYEIYSIDAHSRIFHLVQGVWQQMPGTANYIDAHDQANITMVDSNQDAFFWNVDHWVAMPGQKCSKITIGLPAAACQASDGSIYVADTVDFLV